MITRKRFKGKCVDNTYRTKTKPLTILTILSKLDTYHYPPLLATEPGPLSFESTTNNDTCIHTYIHTYIQTNEQCGYMCLNY